MRASSPGRRSRSSTATSTSARGAGAQAPCSCGARWPARNCQVEVDTLEDLHQLHPEFEAHGLYLGDFVGALFKSPELRNYELARSLPVSLADLVPRRGPTVARLEGAGSRASGAYPARR